MKNQSHIPPDSIFSFTVTEANENTRLDKFISEQFTHYSRSFFQKLIVDKLVKVNNTITGKPGIMLKNGDTVTVQFPPKRIISPKELEEELDVKVIDENEHFLIISKPAGLIVHSPFELSKTASLVDWLLHHYKELGQVGFTDRPGIVHRLDKNTSGLMIIPRSNYAHTKFGDLFKERAINKTYLAIVEGHPDKEGIIEMPIGRDPVSRIKMRAYKDFEKELPSGIRHATTRYKVLEYFDNSSLVEVKPTTGRTHQIRVHFATIGHPLIGDQVYGASSKLIDRHALHAQGLSFEFNGKKYSFSQEPPQDFKELLNKLISDKK